MRLWEKTNEILVLEDERETEREAAAEEEAGESQPVPGEQVIVKFIFLFFLKTLYFFS